MAGSPFGFIMSLRSAGEAPKLSGKTFISIERDLVSEGKKLVLWSLGSSGEIQVAKTYMGSWPRALVLFNLSNSSTLNSDAINRIKSRLAHN